jgi:asparagine synthase (glutamine-hydrolysing)
MCGIVGFTGKTNSEVLEKMTDSIFHRGPDGAAYIVNTNFSVGYRRLAIIDLSENIYPISNEANTIELVSNGEIYNYQELRNELLELGHVFKTQSDSEIIVHGYEEWGKDVVQKLRGMFVFIVLDKDKNELFIARDRLGIKPLYYAKSKGGRYLFGSEIKGIFEASKQGGDEYHISSEPDDKSVFKFLRWRIHDTDENTFFKNVKRLMPGHWMTITESGELNIQKYWKPEVNKEFKSRKPDEDYAAEFKEIFSEAVDLHLIADVPVGLTLSGGLDSSGIAALSKKIYDEKHSTTPGGKQAQEIIAFSAVHPGEKVDESDYIDEVVKFTGIKSVKIQPKVDNFWEDLDSWTYFQEEPVISGAPYAYYTVMREARKHVTVLLSGQGGDELLAGYIPYFMTYLQTAKDQHKYWEMIRESWKGKDLYFKYFMNKVKDKFDRQESISPDLMLNDKFTSNYSNVFQEEVKYSRNLNERLFDDVTRATTPALLRYEDKNSMANSLESRVPFFDHKVVEYIFNLPVDQKIKFGWNRYIYRNAMKGVIPDKNRLRRNKVGFTNPEWEWMERKADNFRSIFESESFKNRPYWNAEIVLNEFNKAVDGKTDGDHLFFWRLFSVEMWLRKYVD